ncbi:phosphatidylinositol N-acetylglucosaminyltransferase subunit C [Phakopsora pachyrhizi]|uniref:Phosphatidylinositol N-acetylglucosaminyltransferase subunit C n=1 Tax=Phakopsora pachyrhizi TaxID=170000 RepID=A0AAV0B3G6_PHAPC|nr:phosphatidylinositol N-acetylglucosaminyltransferase subunit C [Phakopsora pachyrhizi]CAH7677572.1 phosphatidylinositol N-acetylglucosaminyltransferase subunit C [Phakopsora pachyrhizi]
MSASRNFSCESQAKPKFRRVLWCQQPYPDNYQDLTFLNHIHQNQTAQRKIYSYSTLVICSLPLCAHLSSIMIFIGLFVYLYENLISAQEVIWFTVVLGVMGYLVWERSKPERAQAREAVFRSACALIFLLLLLSPVLKTLTISTASDSIWALSSVLLIISILLGDYRDGRESLIEGSLDVSFPSALSLNAAIFASVVLASRLFSNADVFALLLFSVEWYALFPLMRRDVMRKHPNSIFRPIVLNISLSTLAFMIAISLSITVGIIYLLVVPLGVVFGLPTVYIWVQRYKRDLRGPWDCAVPKFS